MLALHAGLTLQPRATLNGAVSTRHTHSRSGRPGAPPSRGIGRLITGMATAKPAAGPAAATLAAVLQREGASEALAAVFTALEAAVKRVAFAVRRAGIDDILGYAEGAEGAGERDRPKKLDVLANELFTEALAASGHVAFIASEEDEEVVEVAAAGQRPGPTFAVVMDPLDGSRNIEASMPTGSIFGVYAVDSAQAAERWRKGETPRGRELVAAAYALYSSATALVASLGQGTQGFILDPETDAFLLTHRDLRVPERGQIYSLNDARFPDWPRGLQRYIEAVRAGAGQSGRQYSARYVCALVADVHRTLLYGGWAGNPRAHLRLVYEANPLAFLAEQAGGRASDGQRPILDIQPQALHQRLPLFLGSPLDIAELEGYGDVQQTGKAKYAV